jgi:hypothetical protein
MTMICEIVTSPESRVVQSDDIALATKGWSQRSPMVEMRRIAVQEEQAPVPSRG